MNRNTIHPLSAILLVAVDGLWSLVDWAALTWVASIPLSFLAVALPTYFIQRSMNGDSRGKAAGLSGLLGVLAAVPTPIMGGTVGFIVLALAGLRGIGFFGTRKPDPLP